MKASELIEALKAIVDMCGDLPVNHRGVSREVSVVSIEVYDESGNEPQINTPPVEIYLH
jgi:hypothetical protein